MASAQVIRNENVREIDPTYISLSEINQRREKQEAFKDEKANTYIINNYYYSYKSKYICTLYS